MILLLEVISKDRYYLGDDFRFKVDKRNILIGRSSACDWVIEDSSRFISSIHLSIRWDQQGYFITDKSTNGTYRGGERLKSGIEAAMPLRHGETLTLGDVKIRVSLQLDPQDVQERYLDDFTGNENALESMEGDKLSFASSDAQLRAQQVRLADVISQEFPELDHGQELKELKQFKDVAAPFKEPVKELEKQPEKQPILKPLQQPEKESSLLNMALKLILVHTQKQMAVDRINNPMHYQQMSTHNIFSQASSVEAVLESHKSIGELKADLQEVLDYLVQSHNA